MALKRLLGVVLGLLIPSLLHAQVAFDAAVGSAQGSASSYTIAHTIGSCTNCEIIVGVGFPSPSPTVSTITWNGTSLSRLCSDASSDNVGELWHLVGPTTGTHNVVVTPSTSAAGAVQIASFSGVDQVTPVGTAVCDHYTANGVTHAHDTTGVTNGMGVDFFALTTAAGTIVANGGQTTRSGPTAQATINTILTTKAGATTINTGYSWDNDFFRWVHSTVGLNPVATVAASLRSLLGVGK